MEIKTTVQGRTAVLAISGELDEFTAPDLRRECDWIVASVKPSRLVLDLKDLSLINSIGVGVIISLFKANRANGGAFEMSGLHGQPEMIFQVLRLDQVFGRKKTEEAADPPAPATAPSR